MSTAPIPRRTAATLSRLAVATGVAASSVLLLSGTAFAHVTVQPQGEAAKGGYATVNFKVPNERDNASTVKLEVSFPADHPLASAMPQPVPGWKAEVTKSKLDKPLEVHGKQITEAVTKITWTATDSKIAPGEFQQFPVSMGRLPENAEQLVFKALQTYDNKEIVRWIEEPAEGGEQPDSPAPVLKLSAAADDHHGGGSSGSSGDAAKGGANHGEAKGEDAGDGETKSSAAADAGDTTARALGIAGILVGAAGLAFGVLTRRRAS
ncbi:YcnI family copper-binding membrane protein [Streptomyces sp. MUM 178J]|uniref:YcnI family copper-binding membrane protein n=1 Tax=Streptomyces sp. MUM 178J TaxID=2791991 RepID=UPI001F038257|nr:YcnI family protein [Streptomyces sp. MUM 178J]WRQ82569.1 YcnI family protein [Streptomyces sp. MUM 178J]